LLFLWWGDPRRRPVGIPSWLARVAFEDVESVPETTSTLAEPGGTSLSSAWSERASLYLAQLERVNGDVAWGALIRNLARPPIGSGSFVTNRPT
jgi:hypothetical protein